MVRRNKAKQLSEVEIERFMEAASAMYAAIVRPVTQCDHYRAMGDLHEALLKAVKDITGKDATFIRWFGAGSRW
ncbi:hypothetical protein EN866_33160 [Mesorhizobium sp. M2D.F.Ca.ET.223.01.1.1]|uniref:hypothetical protein n=1 Tax=Mesorhizobium sp. M2D.F.Ca.ET.223.01.1.1 TaxID=2563940 RepID=UPI00109219A6|nr:hypothetical protein [Mesorhizobium sp. M2D.F.Ca.ET.223.01.1.1]TGR84561.1 hypothetical protein EN866_33160 [Mesorhizobium sp. M2D.F.Ca.ET.223.01.1.1]TGT65971.1 hypothetical protein EN802_30660 [bacterium M00.F.Ca.ET.159.01.1.1]TGT79656.1 hypothetical protein EN800_30000 [bacterium M00.F.Ca.ET.157.01.1.1]